MCARNHGNGHISCDSNLVRVCVALARARHRRRVYTYMYIVGLRTIILMGTVVLGMALVVQHSVYSVIFTFNAHSLIDMTLRP